MQWASPMHPIPGFQPLTGQPWGPDPPTPPAETSPASGVPSTESFAAALQARALGDDNTPRWSGGQERSQPDWLSNISWKWHKMNVVCGYSNVINHPPFITIFMGWIPTIKKWVVYGIATYPHGCFWNISWTFDKKLGGWLSPSLLFWASKHSPSVHIKIVGTYAELPQSWFSLPAMVPWVSHRTSLVGNTGDGGFLE